MSRVFGCTVIALFLAACADRAIEPEGLTVTANGSIAASVGPPGPCCYDDGEVVRTVAPPAKLPHGGQDPFYAFPNGGAEGQLAVIGVGPGDKGYHGGSWAFNAVTWNVTPYLITSDEQLLDAADAGDVTITRIPENDFRCPIQK